eukprot:Skav235013  [mRNA]  locus=scaffold276:177008:178417:- [translate_table: standard]
MACTASLWRLGGKLTRWDLVCECCGDGDTGGGAISCRDATGGGAAAAAICGVDMRGMVGATGAGIG